MWHCPSLGCTMPASRPSSAMWVLASVVKTSRWEASFLQPIFSCGKTQERVFSALNVVLPGDSLLLLSPSLCYQLFQRFKDLTIKNLALVPTEAWGWLMAGVHQFNIHISPSFTSALVAHGAVLIRRRDAVCEDLGQICFSPPLPASPLYPDEGSYITDDCLDNGIEPPFRCITVS